MTYRDQVEAKEAARKTANSLGQDVHILKLRDGYHLFASNDPAFQRHRPATYVTVRPSTEEEG